MRRILKVILALIVLAVALKLIAKYLGEQSETDQR